MNKSARVQNCITNYASGKELQMLVLESWAKTYSDQIYSKVFHRTDCTLGQRGYTQRSPCRTDPVPMPITSVLFYTVKRYTAVRVPKSARVFTYITQKTLLYHALKCSTQVRIKYLFKNEVVYKTPKAQHIFSTLQESRYTPTFLTKATFEFQTISR